VPKSSISCAAQFSLSHLFAWIGATCAVFAFQQWRLNTGETRDDELFRWYFNIQLCFVGPLDGACYAALVLIPLRRFRVMPPFPQEPGHWFLVVRGVSLLLSDSIEVVMYLLPQHDTESLSQALSFTWAVVVAVAQAAPAGIAAIQVWRSLWWRTAFLLMVVYFAFNLLHTGLYYAVRGNAWFLNPFAWGLASLIMYSLPATCAAIAAISDRQRGIHRDFLHSAGTTVMILYAVTGLVAWVAWRQMFG
jgi:hypothetical protein